MKLFIGIGISLSSTSFAIRMGVVCNSTSSGEREVGLRIKNAAEILGWEVVFDNQLGAQIFHRTDLDWTIHLVPSKVPSHGYHYMTVFQSYNLLNYQGKIFAEHEVFDGYLLGIKPEFFNGVWQSKSKSFHYIPFYPSVQPTEYIRLELNDLVTTYPAWGHRRVEEKYKKLFQLLSQSGFVKFYGKKIDPQIVQKGNMGEIPFDGISLIPTLQKHGITLILHSWHHRSEGIPAARIFEAVAASTVVISDENPFIKKHFGDLIYYIDVTLSAEEIFEQIMNHRRNIMNNPEEALEKAKRAHQIFIEQFLLTDQLLELQKMHDKIKMEHINDK